MRLVSRIGLVVPAFAQGGGVPVVADFLRRIALASGRHEVRVVSLATACDDPASLRVANPRSWLRGPQVASYERAGTPFVHVGAVVPEFEFQRYRPRAALKRALDECDLIQMVCGFPAWANAITGFDKPVALQVATRARIERRTRDANGHGIKDRWRKSMTAITDRMDDRALRRVHAIQVENHWMLEYARGITAGRRVDLRFAPPGIDVDRFHPIAHHERLRDPYILCVARLADPRKNVTLLLDVFARLPAVVRNQARLVLAGASAPPAEFWRLADASGIRKRIAYIHRPDDEALLALYQHATVFVLPSDEEGFGMVLLEAMACGVPVVSTRCGGPDSIISNGVDGSLVPVNDAEAMAACLLRLLQEPAVNVAMGEAGRRTVKCRYDEQIAGAVYLDIWQKLLRLQSHT